LNICLENRVPWQNEQATMGKYDPLREHLRKQNLREIILTFQEVEDLIGFPLPASAARPQWWANVTDQKTTHVQRNAWREAGFDAFLIAGSSKVRFQKVRPLSG
jgi:hypothetical protein